MNILILLLVALCTAELVHNALEVWGILEKLQWLKDVLEGKAHGKWPINITTWPQIIEIHTLVLLASVAASIFVLHALQLSSQTLVEIGIVTLLVNYVMVVWRLDTYHRRIGVLIRKGRR